MIKINEIQYRNAFQNHRDSITPFIETQIQFYAYCFQTLNSHQTFNADTFIRIGKRRIGSLVSSLCKVDTQIVFQNLPTIFNEETNFHEQVRGNLLNLLALFNDLLNPTATLYFKIFVEGDPIELRRIHQILLIGYEFLFEDQEIKEPFKTIFEKIFNYEDFKNDGINNWNAYDLTNSINLKVCPYCNRLFTYTVRDRNNGALTRPELDHYLPKSKYPYFSLSFFNLIPCCNICNSIKRDNEFSSLSIFHPYLENDTGEEDIHFEFRYDENSETVEEIKEQLIISINPKPAHDGNIETFLDKLETIYQEHKDISAISIWKKKIYTDEYIEFLAEQGSNGDPLEIENNIRSLRRAIFPQLESHLDIANIPLGKLMKESIETQINNI